MKIRKDNLCGNRIQQFLQEHLDEMHSITPPESVHALDLDGLRSPDITFWSAWTEERLLGCGALKVMDAVSGEIKSMRTDPSARGQGVASMILQLIIDEARNLSLRQLHLETGAFPEFMPARKLYERFGFEYCGPFGHYTEDPNSVFMARSI